MAAMRSAVIVEPLPAEIVAELSCARFGHAAIARIPNLAAAAHE